MENKKVEKRQLSSHAKIVRAVVMSTNDDGLNKNEKEKKIGTGRPGNDAIELVTVHVPLDAKIVRHGALMRNAAWPDGPDWGTNWVPAKYGSEPMGWCRCDFVGEGTTQHAKTVTVEFHNWSNEKPRVGKLQVFFKPANVNAEDVSITSTEPTVHQSSPLP